MAIYTSGIAPDSLPALPTFPRIFCILVPSSTDMITGYVLRSQPDIIIITYEYLLSFWSLFVFFVTWREWDNPPSPPPPRTHAHPLVIDMPPVPVSGSNVLAPRRLLCDGGGPALATKHLTRLHRYVRSITGTRVLVNK